MGKRRAKITSAIFLLSFPIALLSQPFLLTERHEFKLEMIIPPVGSSIDDYEWLKSFAHIAKNCPRPYILFALFISVCEGCYSGSVINVLKEIQARGGDGLDIYCLVSHNYSENDVLGMTSQIQINFPVLPVDALFSKKWSELAKVYGEDSLNAIVFIMDRNAFVVDALSSAQTARQFFDKCLQLSMMRYEE